MKWVFSILFILKGLITLGQVEPPESARLVLDSQVDIGECLSDFWDFQKGNYIYVCDLKTEALDKSAANTVSSFQGEITVTRIWKEVFVSKKGKWKKTDIHITEIDCEVLGDRICNWIEKVKGGNGGELQGEIVIERKPGKNSLLKVEGMVFDENGIRKK
ncbi:MAG: hypothetical protein H6581_00300 [Bacteroidia bacterium]|nr:hypothetical protein [Bacteroidia bacterium]